ncbi:hypothetical protein MRB53_023359 [Persea americana]|uniref:Uncharacterized protein n=1 Tax=Persea americana TaxID=3435 RepID=A0ACC2LA27_PERAE|nr:hypothetical protein MRB53_023359 [Persea americana]
MVCDKVEEKEEEDEDDSGLYLEANPDEVLKYSENESLDADEFCEEAEVVTVAADDSRTLDLLHYRHPSKVGGILDFPDVDYDFEDDMVCDKVEEKEEEDEDDSGLYLEANPDEVLKYSENESLDADEFCEEAEICLSIEDVHRQRHFVQYMGVGDSPALFSSTNYGIML